MSTDWRNNEEVQHAVRNLFLGVVPERRDEMADIWARYQLRFNVLQEVEPEGRFIMDAGAFRDVRFNHRTMRAFWLAGFIAWEGYTAIHRTLVTGQKDFGRFNGMIEVFFCILRADDSTIVPLPEGVPEPGTYPDGAETRVAAELSTFAVGWALLHEVRHIRHQHEGTSTGQDATLAAKHAEELSCDEFATRFMLERADEYASAHSVDAGLVRQKREIGIYFALFALTLVGADSWGSSDTHPAMQTRIDSVIRQMNGNGTRMSDAIAHAAFGALWFRWSNAPGPFKQH